MVVDIHQLGSLLNANDCSSVDLGCIAKIDSKSSRSGGRAVRELDFQPVLGSNLSLSDKRSKRETSRSNGSYTVNLVSLSRPTIPHHLFICILRPYIASTYFKSFLKLSV